ncbi:MAG TPA: alpha/beta fold hydrolase [Dokdonella sp.]|uniref:alpha/beta hydrolase n=1 Tax=Dokdonella sp. TaxID=2291710 RepID=UPI002D808A47|nr:alpha/beta fold hydrolase [Dokdonella sp.]HET9032317.1 alpha/beta fold hydrolase [Dokdonella sp.]
MKRGWAVLLGVLLLAGIGTWSVGTMLQSPQAQAATPDPAKQRLATKFLDLLDAGKFGEALAMGTPTLRKGLADGKLQQAWEAVPAQLGPRQSRGHPRAETINGSPAVSSRLQFGMMALDARIVFDDDNAISGFWIVPATGAPAAASPDKSASHAEKELTISKDGIALPATLTLPDNGAPYPAVVLVHGSGPHDRDETIGPNKPFLDLANGLAERGIAVLRYEKRTMAHPDRFAHGDFTVDDETVNDALAAVALLREQKDIDPQRIFVLGHSLGAMMAPRIGQRDRAIAGLILLAAPASKLEDIVIRQTRYLARLQGQGDAEIDKAVAEIEPQIEAVKHLDSSASDKTPLLLGLPASYWRDLNRYDPIDTARAIRQPILLLQGDRDYQVTVADEFSQWRKAFATNPRFELIEYPMLGHAFMPGNDPPGPKDYEKAAHVDSKVIDDIAAWITRNRS